jgi:hypothetical protein
MVSWRLGFVLQLLEIIVIILLLRGIQRKSRINDDFYSTNCYNYTLIRHNSM